MKIRKNLNDIFTVILVVCAIIVTVIVIKREFFGVNSIEEVKIVLLLSRTNPRQCSIDLLF